MYSFRATALFFCLANALLVCRRALSLEAQAETHEVSKADNRRTSGNTAVDDEVLKNILPLVTFDCLGKSGYFADKKFECKVFHYCDPDGSRSTFHCPRDSFFNSELMVCEELSENKKSLCRKREEGGNKETKTLNKSASDPKDVKLKNFRNAKKKTVEKHSPKSKETEDLGHMSSDSDRSLANKMRNMGGIMTLEDMLSYMNSEDDSEQPKTFVSTFLKTSGDRSAKALVNSSIINPFKKLKDHYGYPQKVDPQNISTKEKTREDDFPMEDSDEHIAERLKVRRGRRGRTLASDDLKSEVRGGRHRSHVSARSPAENPDSYDSAEEIPNYGQWSERTISKESSAPPSRNLRLFNIESRRNTTDPWRKRKRYYRRRRKHKSQLSLPISAENSQDNSTDLYEHTTDIFQQNNQRKPKGLDAAEWQRSILSPEIMKSHVPPVNDATFLGSYSGDINQPTDYSSQHTPVNKSHGFNEDSVTGNKERKVAGSSIRNPWFKSTFTTEEDNYNLRFGERTTASGTGVAPEPYYGDENGSIVTSDFLGFEEKPDRDVNQNSKTPVVLDEITAQRPKLKQTNERKPGSFRKGEHKSNDRRPVEDEEHTYRAWNLEDGKVKQKKVPDVHISSSRVQAKGFTSHQTPEREWSNNWSPIVHEVSTLTPASSPKSAFVKHYDHNTPDIVEDDGVRWKQREKSEGRVKTKVPVGSSFKYWNEVPKPHTQVRTHLNNTQPVGAEQFAAKSTAQPIINIHRDRKKEWPKHTMAHQHLSKVMNDFLAIPPINLGLPKVSPMASHVPFQTYVPKYRIPNEDIYASESVAKDVVKNQPDIYEIVDLLSKHSRDKLKETTKSSDVGSGDHRLTIKDAILSMKSMGANRGKTSTSDIDISNLREALDDILKTDVGKILGNDHSKEYVSGKQSARIIQGSIRKLAELSKEEQEELKQITEIAKFTSLRLRPLLSSVLDDSSKEDSGDSKTLIERKPSRPTILTAKKVPVRVLYRDDVSTSKETTPKFINMKAQVKAIPTRSRPETPHFRIVSRRPQVPPANIPFMILHPPSLRPPHPPPLQTNHPFPVMNIPHAGIRPTMYHQSYPYIPRRRKRSPQFHVQLRPRRMWNYRFFSRRKRSPQFRNHIESRRWNYSPFAHGVVPSFTPSYGSSLFRRPFSGQRLTMPNLSSPFRLSHALSGNNGIIGQRKPSLRKPVFLPRQPVRNMPQTAHQTVIIEEVPIPIPVEVPELPPSRVPVRNPIKAAETVRHQRLPQLQDHRGQSTMHIKPVQLQHPQFPYGIGVLGSRPQSRPSTSTYGVSVLEPSTQSRPAPGTYGVGILGPNSHSRPAPGTYGIGVLETSPLSRPAPSNYNQSTNPGHGIVRAVGFREPKFQFPLPVSQNPIGPFPLRVTSNYNRNPPDRALKTKPPVILTPAEFQNRPQSPQFALPFDTKNLHLNSYPNFPYFQSGPPASFAQFLSPEKVKQRRNPDNSNVMSPELPSEELKRHPSPTRPGKVFDIKYKETAVRVSTPSTVTSSSGGLFVVTPPDSSTFPHYLTQSGQNIQREPSSKLNWSEESTESTENGVSSQRQNEGVRSSSGERKHRRRRPGTRRRRPRPNATQGINNSTVKATDQSDMKPSLNVWRASSPPQQIPPPPSEITSDPFNLVIRDDEQRNAISHLSINIPSYSNPNISDESNVFPPAGYYGSEQLSQLFETSFSNSGPVVHGDTSTDSSAEIKSSTLVTTEQPTEEYNLFSQEEAAFYDDGTGQGRVPFGTRLTNKPRSRSNTLQNTQFHSGSQENIKDIRSMQLVSPQQERYHVTRGTPYHETRIQNSHARDTIQLPPRRKPDRSRYSTPNIRPTKPHDVRGIRPEVIYYDTREHPEGLFKIESDAHDSQPPSPVIMRTHPGNQDMFHLPNPHADRDLFGMHPPTSKPIRNNGVYGVVPPRNPPRERKVNFLVPRRPHTDTGSGRGLAVSNAPPRIASLRQEENPQNQFRIREIKRPTAAPKIKSEIRTSSLLPETTTARPHLISTQVDHQSKEFHRSPDYPYYQPKEETITSPKDVITQRWTIKTTTAAPFTVPQPFKDDKIETTTMSNIEPKTTDYKSAVIISREIPKAIQGSKLDFRKINATISTSVSVSTSNGGNHVSSVETSAEGQPKKVFSSKNGGLAVVRKGSRQRKRNRNRQRTTISPKIENMSSSENGLNEHEKLQIAASIQDIIKATSETEKHQGTPSLISDAINSTAPTIKVVKKWILPLPEAESQAKKIT